MSIRWQAWFAWRPVTLEDGRIAWLRIVQRRRSDQTWRHREMPDMSEY